MYTKLIDMLREFSDSYIDGLEHLEDAKATGEITEDLYNYLTANAKNLDPYDEETFSFNDFIDDHLDPGYTDRKFLLEGDQITVEAEWGGEGDGAIIYKVLKWRDQLVQLSAHYSSWDSTYWAEGAIIPVVEKSVTTTRYVKEQ